MSGSSCGPGCGYCGGCTAAWERTSDPDGYPGCDHPAHWRTEDGGCGLCKASAGTIKREAAQRAHAGGVR